MRRWRTVQGAGGQASRYEQSQSERARVARFPVERKPLLSITKRSGVTRGVVLLLHGGRAESRSLVRRGNLTVVRMRMFAPSILAAAGDAGIARAVPRHLYR